MSATAAVTDRAQDPRPGDRIEVQTLGGPVGCEVRTVQELGRAGYRVVVAETGGRIVGITMVRVEDGGWRAISGLDGQGPGAGDRPASPPDIAAAIATARRAAKGRTGHGSVTGESRLLAEAVLYLAGLAGLG